MLSPDAPLLICLNLRRECVGSVNTLDLYQVLYNAAAALCRARAEGWGVAHAYAPVERMSGRKGVLKGFEPLIHEPVYSIRAVSAMSETLRAGLSSGSTPMPVHLIGAVYSRLGLDALLAMRKLGLGAHVLQSACFGSDLDGSERAQLHALTSRDAGQTFSADGENVIWLKTRRT